jgi:hypothetical protein
MSFKNVLLGTMRKFYTHDLSFDNNTTMEFGVLQPLLSQYMFPNATIKVDSRQLVRLAPMPTPSFARMYLANYASFVKMSDVVPYHECLLSKIPFSASGRSYLPLEMPYTSNRALMYALLQSSFVDYFELSSGDNKTYIHVTRNDKVALINASFVSTFLGSVSTSDLLYPKFNWVHTSTKHAPQRLYPSSADFSVNFGPNHAYLMTFKFSNSSLRLRKVLLGLGYGLIFNDKSHLSIAPLLAYYKAYYDRFGLVRDLPFESTICFQLIKVIENYSTVFDLSNPKSSNITLFYDFLHKELSECWYTDANSYIAAQRSSLINNVPTRKLYTLDQQNAKLSAQGTALSTSSTSLPFIGTQSEAYFTQLSLDVLKRLTTFVNKDSVIGRRISSWVRVHYGAEVSNSLFEQSSRIKEWRTNISIDDVFSTSDTADIATKDKGEYLGAYAGKGSGFSNDGFTFKAPVHGFVFVFSCIVPVTNTFQGNDPTLLAVDLDTIPQPEFDALGFEATPRSVFVGDNGVSKDSSRDYASTFGFVPRYTGFKCKKNVVNGDMFKGYFQTDLIPYFNDRILYNNRLDSKLVVDSSGLPVGVTFDLSIDQVPDASTEFQKICRYHFLGDYDRLFYNSSSDFTKVQDDLYPSDDNFIVQSVFAVKVSNFLKPVQSSYDTFDTEEDNNTTPVSSI